MPAAQFVMMTFVNMHSPGLKILATHRVLRNLNRADGWKSIAGWSQRTETLDGIKRVFSDPQSDRVRIGVAYKDGFTLLERPRAAGEMDVPVLHREIIGGALGISEEAVRDEKYIHYVRGIDAAVAQLKEGADVAFLLEPTPIEEMARVAFAGGVMPQKSTDFYPKLLSGVTIYRL